MLLFRSGARHSGEPLAAGVRQVQQAGDEQARAEDQRRLQAGSLSRWRTGTSAA